MEDVDAGTAGAASAAAAVVSPARSLLEWGFNYCKEREKSVCQGLRASSAHGRLGAMATRHITLSRAGPWRNKWSPGNKLTGRSRPGAQQ